MKKRIFTIAAVCAAVCCLGACAEHKEPVKDELEALNAMLKADYSQIVLTVTDTFDETASLTSEYTFTYSGDTVTVAYTVERFAGADDMMNDPLGSLKTTLTGEAVIKDGVIVSLNGDDVGLTADNVRLGLTFKAEYFEVTEISGVRFTADVKNVRGFLDWTLPCTNMKVRATFLEVFYDIQITYTSAIGSNVEYKYVFTL